MSQSNTPPRMTALGLLEQMRRSNAANREAPFDPIAASARERRAGPSAPLFGGQRQQPLPIPPTPPAVIPPPPPQQGAPQAAAAPQARTPAQALPLPPRPPQLGADGNPIPPALLPQVPGAERLPMHERFNPENPYVAAAIQMAERYNLPRNVFLSVINQESSFRPDAVSRVGAIGFGQLMPGTARDMGVDPTDPMQNLEGSARYLRSMLDRHKGDMPLALASYNAGPGRVQRAGNTIPNLPETQKYVPEVLRNAGVPGYAGGGLAHLEQKYSEGGPVASLPTYDYHVRANRIRTPRAPRPAPREELTADQLNAMVLDRLARRAAAEPESSMAAEARDRIGRTMSYAEGGLADLHQKYEGGGLVSTLTGLARRATRRSPPALRPDEVPMVAMHNAREIGLQKIADNDGVVVAPSIGISRADEPMDSFGEISLMASPQTIDPRRTPVYGRDAYTPRYPSVIPMTVRGRDKDYVRLYNENTGESRLLPHTPRNALRVMTNDPWRGGEDFITDNWLLGQMTPQFRNMSELRGARDRLVPATDKSVEDWQNQLGALRQEFREALPDSIRDNFNFIDSHTRNMAEAVQRGPGGMEYINRNYYNNAIPEELLERTRAHLETGRDLPTTYFEAKPRRIVPLSEFQGAVVPFHASQDVTDLLRRYGVDDIRYYTNPDMRDEQIRRFERLMFGAAPVAAGAAVEAAADAPEPEGYAEGGRVMSDEEYDRRLLERMKRDTGRTTESTNAEQARALRSAGSDAAGLASDILLPQSPLDAALMVALGPGGRMARLAGSAALMAMEPSEAEAGGLRRLIRAYHGSPHRFDEFDPEAAAHWFSESEDSARRFGKDRMRVPLNSPKNPAMYEVNINGNLQTIDPMAEATTIARQINEPAPSNWDEAGNILQWGTYQNDVLDEARQLGFDGVRFVNVGDVPGNVGGDAYDTQYAITNPRIIDITRRYAQGGLAHLEHKYAEGGAVSAQPAIYDPDAVNTLANQIEAGYV
jgi:Transglycosylase SLT domain